MKSQKGLTLVRFVLIILVLILLLGVTIYVAMQQTDEIEEKITNKMNNSVTQDNSAIN